MSEEKSTPGEWAALELPAFGPIEPERVLAQDDLFAVVRDKYPVAPGHTLIIPRRPVQRFRELTAPEKARLLEWVDWAQQHLEATLSPAPDGFNLGVNDGKVAGQTVPQFHFHVIPRCAGDVAKQWKKNPQGIVKPAVVQVDFRGQQEGESADNAGVCQSWLPRKDQRSG